MNIPLSGFQSSAEHFFIFVLTLCLTSIGGTAMAFAASALISVFAVANLIVSLIYVFSMVSKFFAFEYI